jgi:hypothetical protein
MAKQRGAGGGKPPRGFKRAGQQSALKRIKTMMQSAEEFLAAKGVDSKVYIHVNRDDSIDAELKIQGQRGLPTRNLFKMLHQPRGGAFPNQNIRGLWVSVGVRFNYQNDFDPYSRFKGLSQIQSHYRRYLGEPGTTERLTLPLTFLAAEKITERVEGRIDRDGKRREKVTRKKADHLFVRLNWNPDNRQPARPKSRKSRKRDD